MDGDLGSFAFNSEKERKQTDAYHLGREGAAV